MTAPTTVAPNPFEKYDSKCLYDMAIVNRPFIDLVNSLAGTTDISEWEVYFKDTPRSHEEHHAGFEVMLPYGMLSVILWVRQGWVYNPQIQKSVPTGHYNAYADVALRLPPVPIKTNYYDTQIIHSDARSRNIANGAATIDELGIENGKFNKKFATASKTLAKVITDLRQGDFTIIDQSLKRAADCTSNKDVMPVVYQTLVASGHFDDRQKQMLRHLFKDAGLL